MKKILALLLALALACVALSGCGGKPASADVAALSFSEATSIDAIRALNGKKVTIVGYMATLSPVSGKYMYLMNMPYQSCPFCVPNTTQLANTMAVYAPEGKTFTFTDQAVRVTGVMQTGDYTDEYGYVYNYRIVDASYEAVDLSAVSENYALWQTIASDGIVGEINAMFDYLYFLCQWTEYALTYTDENGESQTVSMYPGDVKIYLADDSVYGYADKSAEDYFPGLVARLKAISETELDDLVQIVEDAKAVETYALSELYEEHYTYDREKDRFDLTNSEELYNRWYAVYVRFSEWLAKWQL
ncbi:MAG: hypothetical protein IKS52_03470 [Clostridia bacterium]|nr:hypothetical protein [Clostridia bacterium]